MLCVGLSESRVVGNLVFRLLGLAATNSPSGPHNLPCCLNDVQVGRKFARLKETKSQRHDVYKTRCPGCWTSLGHNLANLPMFTFQPFQRLGPASSRQSQIIPHARIVGSLHQIGQRTVGARPHGTRRAHLLYHGFISLISPHRKLHPATYNLEMRLLSLGTVFLFPFLPVAHRINIFWYKNNSDITWVTDSGR